MESARSGQVIVARLDDGEELLASVEAMASREAAGSALVVSGIGMLRNARLGYWDGKGYRESTLDGPVELLSLLGSCAPSSVHLHAVVGLGDHSTAGGHVLGGTVQYVNEVTMLALDGIGLSRKEDPATGLRVMTLDRRSDGTASRK
ncbi:MAG: DUF296 domain-containing protein [Thermoplasmata archaeon]|nr:DUF296 domain-containing protein [Thermoplasmata archaeon]